jgi:hypothetical protein
MPPPFFLTFSFLIVEFYWENRGPSKTPSRCSPHYFCKQVPQPTTSYDILDQLVRLNIDLRANASRLL